MESYTRKLRNELFRHFSQVLQHLSRASVKCGFMVMNSVVVAKRRNDGVDVLEIVPRYLGEQVVVHLELQASAKPIHKPVTGYVARCRYLISKVAKRIASSREIVVVDAWESVFLCLV